MLPYRLLRRTQVRPYVTYSLIALCFGVFFWELTLDRATLMKTFTQISITGCQVTTEFFSPKTWLDMLRSMFLHGGWAHLLGNMLYLAIFGPAIEEYFGKWRFMGFYLFAGVAAALSQIFVMNAIYDFGCALPAFTRGNVPMIGASGAISGILGGFILMHPGVKVRAMVPLFRGVGPSFDTPAIFVLGLWFGLQLLNGFLALNPSSFLTGGVAFWAHIGGFIFGAVTIFFATTFVPAPPQNIIED